MADPPSDPSNAPGSSEAGYAPAAPPVAPRGKLSRAKAVVRRWLLEADRRLVGEHRPHGRIAGRRHAIYHLSIDGLSGPFLLVRGHVAISGWALDIDRGRPLPVRVRIGRRVTPLEPVARPDLVQAFGRLSALPERCGVAIQTPVRPGARLLTIEVESGEGGWIVIDRRLMVSLGMGGGGAIGPFRSVGTPDYAVWRERDLARRAGQFASQRESCRVSDSAPRATILVCGSDRATIDRTLASLEAQTETRWDAILVGGEGRAEHGLRAAPTFDAAIRSLRSDYVLPLEAGDQLDPDALSLLIAVANEAPELDLIYADEERVSPRGATYPVFKPAWSPDTLEGFDYVGAPALIRTRVDSTVGAASRHELLLRLAGRRPKVRHLPAILCRRDAAAATDAPAIRALVMSRPNPLISIVIPTAGGKRIVRDRVVDLVVNCVESIRTMSRYPAYEIVIVAGADLRAETKRSLSDLGCRLALDERTDFNFSRKINLGAAAAQGECLVLLNDDMQVVSADWLERLLGQGLKPHVGVVGGKLLFADDTIQHAGIVIQNGVPLHVRQDFPAEDLGSAFSTALPRNYAAVTGACMMIRRALFDTLGGFCERFPVNFNDVDFCFRVRRFGLFVVYEPGCVLYHFASSSRDARVPPHEYRHFRDHWAAELTDDPYYSNAAFSVGPPAFEPFMRD